MPGRGDDASGNSVCDFIRWRFYLDGEANASIVLSTAQGHLVGNASSLATWGNELVGKGAKTGGWHNNIPIQFSKSIRVTLQQPDWMPAASEGYDTYAQARAGRSRGDVARRLPPDLPAVLRCPATHPPTTVAPCRSAAWRTCR
jgi:hypothetical protein